MTEDVSIPLRCRLGWHRWPKWTGWRKTTLARFDESGKPIHDVEAAVQDRDCPDCGRLEWRKV